MSAARQRGTVKYKTIRSAKDLQLGRLAIAFEVDLGRRMLYVNLIKGRDLVYLADPIATPTFHVRVQILPCLDIKSVAYSLFSSPGLRPQASHAKSTHQHGSTLHPMLQQEFSFDIGRFTEKPRDFRLYVAFMGQRPRPGQVTACLGCTSFGMNTLLEQSESLPTWFWLHADRKGLITTAPVQRQRIEVDPDLATGADVEIFGRAEDAANAFVNGTYDHQEGEYAGRPIYRNGRTGLFLYFHGSRRAWAVGDAVGSVAPYAFCGDPAYSPDQVRAHWVIFNQERSYHAPRKDVAAGSFEQDLYVGCRIVGRDVGPLPLNRVKPGNLWFDRERTHELQQLPPPSY